MAAYRKFTCPVGFTNDGVSVEAKGFYDPNLAEWSARLYLNDVEYVPARYFTDDKDDCIATARKMVTDYIAKADAPPRRPSTGIRIEWESNMYRYNTFIGQSFIDVSAYSTSPDEYSGYVAMAPRAELPEHVLDAIGTIIDYLSLLGSK